MPAEGLIDQWAALARDDGAVFLKERLDWLGRRRAEIEAVLEELNGAVEEIDREAVDRALIMEGLGQFAEVFEGMAPYQQKELIRLVVPLREDAGDGPGCNPTTFALSDIKLVAGSPGWCPGARS